MVVKVLKTDISSVVVISVEGTTMRRLLHVLRIKSHSIGSRLSKNT